MGGSALALWLRRLAADGLLGTIRCPCRANSGLEDVHRSALSHVVAVISGCTVVVSDFVFQINAAFYSNSDSPMLEGMRLLWLLEMVTGPV